MRFVHYLLLGGLQIATISPVLAQKNIKVDAPTEIPAVSNVPSFRLVSTIALPIDISLTDLEKQINQSIGTEIYKDDSFTNNNNDDLKVLITKTKNMVFTSATNNIFDFAVPIKIWVQKGYGAFGIKQYGETSFEVIMRFSTAFNLLPDWKIKTVTTPKGFSYVTKPTLKVGGVEIPIAAVVTKLMQANLQDIASTIDETISKEITLDKYVVQAWNTAQTPYLLDEEYQTWLQFTPLEVSTTPITYDKRKIKLTVGLKAYTETSIGKKPQPAAPITKAPPFKSSTTIAESFKVSLVNTIGYEEATNLAKKKFIGTEYSFKEGKYKISIEDVSVLGSGDKLVFQIQLTGSLKGTIYLKALPIYDPTTQAIVLGEPEFDIKTKNVLVKLAAWIFDGTLEKKIQKEFQVPLATMLADGQKSVEEAINSEYLKGVKLMGKVIHITPDQIFVTPEGITATVLAEGKLQLLVQGMN